MAILRNVCRAEYAGNARLVFTADAGEPQATPIWREDGDTPEQALLRRHDRETMRRLIGELPAEFREAIVLREINDLSYREIATVIEAPIGTVMSRLARARGMLRDAWIAAEGGRQPMTCEEAEHLLHALIDGELDAGHAREVEAHLASLRRLRGALARIREMREAMRRRAWAMRRRRLCAPHRRPLPAPVGAAEPASRAQGLRAGRRAWARWPRPAC